MHKKNGFMMMEVLIAIFILMFTTVNIINVQFRALYRAADDRDEIMHLFKLKKELYEVLLFPEKKDFKRKLVFEDEGLTIIKEQRPIAEKSSLASLSSQLAAVTIDGSWKSQNKARTSRLSGIIYHQQQEPTHA